MAVRFRQMKDEAQNMITFVNSLGTGFAVLTMKRKRLSSYMRIHDTYFSFKVINCMFLHNFSRNIEIISGIILEYGPAEIPTEVDPSLKGHLISINLVYVNENGQQKVIKKRIHLSLAVYKLIAIAKRAFNINTDSLNLVRVSAKVSASES